MKKTSCKCGPSCACKNCVCGPQAAFFDTLGNEGRLYIVHELRSGPKTVSQLIETTRMEQTHVSHNLKRLEQSGLVTATKEGKYRKYELSPHLEPLLKLIDKHTEYRAPAAKTCCCGGKK
jgi:DNA-binding transcriptional ArsR family regulator